MPSSPDFIDATPNRTGLLGRAPACLRGSHAGPPAGRSRRSPMIVVFFLIGALALLATVLLFGFVGCAPFSGTPSPEPPPASGSPPAPGSSTSPGSPTAPGSPTPPDYGKMVLSTPDLVAYWRLEEPAATLVQPASDAGAARYIHCQGRLRGVPWQLLQIRSRRHAGRHLLFAGKRRHPHPGLNPRAARTCTPR